MDADAKPTWVRQAVYKALLCGAAERPPSVMAGPVLGQRRLTALVDETMNEATIILRESHHKSLSARFIPTHTIQ